MVIQREFNNVENININAIGIITPVNSSGEDSNGSNSNSSSSSIVSIDFCYAFLNIKSFLVL